MNEFIIVFRETLEASLIVGIIYTILIKNELYESIRKLWIGVAAALVFSIFVGYFVYILKESFSNESARALFESVFMFITAGLIWYVIFWLSKHVSDRKQIEAETNTAVQASTWGIFFVIFFSILREGFETAIFLLGSFSMTGSFSYLGFTIGAALAILIGYLVVVQGKKINLRSFFQATTLLLVFLASGMIAYGTHEAESYLVKSDNLQLIGLEDKSDISRPWDILRPKDSLDETDNSFFYSYDLRGKQQYTHIMHDSGRVGVFLKGFFGYNSNPNYIELLFWIISLIGGIALWRSFYRPAT
jgi:high-affinity iron transporter